jgi:hypothetical protein
LILKAAKLPKYANALNATARGGYKPLCIFQKEYALIVWGWAMEERGSYKFNPAKVRIVL